MVKLKYWLWLVMVFGVSNVRLWDVMELFDDPESAYEKLCSGEHNLKLKERELQNIRSFSLEKSMKIIELCNSRGIGVLGYSSQEYPKCLRHIYNPPAILFYRGNINILNQKPLITIVGTRHATQQSILTAQRLSGELAMQGFVITSGFALGIDIAVSLSAVDKGLPTVCVLGCGVDVEYPRENIIYRDRILENNGLFISEYFLGTPAYPQNFPKRNRILSGISGAVVVIEADIKSGSLITAECALEQGREVFFVPPANIYDKRYAGNIKFLRDGATPVYGYEDIADCFDMLSSEIPLNDEIEYISTDGENENISEDIENRSIDISEDSELTEIQKKIVEVLKNGITHIDVISLSVEIDMSELVIELTELEIKGIVKKFTGNLYELKS